MSLSFLKACMNFFEKKPGQTYQDFFAELKWLSPQDRLDLIPALELELRERIQSSEQKAEMIAVPEVLQEPSEGQAEENVILEVGRELGEKIEIANKAASQPANEVPSNAHQPPAVESYQEPIVEIETVEQPVREALAVESPQETNEQTESNERQARACSVPELRQELGESIAINEQQEHHLESASLA